MILALQLYYYIKKRAAVEGVGFDLEIDTFQESASRCMSTFGVFHANGEMLYDEQEPYDGFFQQTKREIIESN